MHPAANDELLSIFMELFQRLLEELPAYKQIKKGLERPGLQHISGCVPSQKEHLLSGLAKDYRQTVVITYDEQKASEMMLRCSVFDRECLFYPAVDPMFYEADIRGNYISEQRLEVVQRLYRGDRLTVFTTAGAFADRLVPFRTIEKEILHIRTGETLDTKDLAEKLVALGYENETQVTAHGEFALRGNIVDIFPFTAEAPYRVDLWGDEIESIAYFDTESQRSIEKVPSFDVFPGGDTGAEEGVSFLDYFDPEETLFVVDEPVRVFSETYIADEGDGEEGGSAVTQKVLEDLAAALRKRRCITLSLLDNVSDWLPPEQVTCIETKNIPSYNGRFMDLVADLKKYKKDGYRVLLYSASQTRGEHLAGNLAENGISAFFSEDTTIQLKPGQIMVTCGALRVGFSYPQLKFTVISEVDIFGARRATRRRKKKYAGDPIKDFTDLNIGDYVVHENHGVGIYKGIERITVDHAEKDYMKIEYANHANLFVLATQFDKIQKYAGAEAARPKINKLGGKEWAGTKARVSSAVQDIAAELVRLYAVRQSKAGYRYGPDTVWQKEFEEAFEFEETDDQLRAIADVKADMESGRIMDRLICGDVGFGKTEVAIRAAFKAVQEGRQVAVLVPTTILAQQHYNTFTQRMSNYPVQIKLLSRFTTTAEAKAIFADLKSGMADIVIGTHRLLSRDIVYKDLGLLVIDEEQRFGVTHKEKIKNLRKDVDVLTLSATPIPRTLHMSLSGIRDMSLLTEPPVDRVPIQTYVMEYSEAAVKEAILRESRRGGQVYYIYNRVNNIEQIAGQIQQMVPHLNVRAAHGQMRGPELEQIMYDFTCGSIDVLVSTTIIETGMDISNVNTIIIHDADNFGLAQLYQLRGRVGRANRTAYAFLMYRRDKLLREVAEKRLKAIREFSELGSGIKIAMRDLEIRGAGNVLGAEQSGHMEAVGYELYCKMLNQAVALLKGEDLPEDFETTIDLNIDGFIPSEYIKNEFEKLNMYKRISAITCAEDQEDIAAELKDRYGDVPRVVENLLSVALLKARAHEVYITEISGGKNRFKISLYPNAKIDTYKMYGFLKSFDGRLKFVNETQPYFLYTPEKPAVGVAATEKVLLSFFGDMETIMDRQQEEGK